MFQVLIQPSSPGYRAFSSALWVAFTANWMIIWTILELVESLFACASQQKWNLSKEIRRSNRVCWARACRNLPGPPVNVVLVSRLGLRTRRRYKDQSGSLRRRTVGDAARMVHPSLQYFLTFRSRRHLCSCLPEDQMSAVLNKSIALLSRPSTLHRSFNLTVNFKVFSQRGQ